jgi:hypothetical protein
MGNKDGLFGDARKRAFSRVKRALSGNLFCNLYLSFLFAVLGSFFFFSYLWGLAFYLGY